jgi:sugar phosphate isomerase/epimerase
MRMNKIALAPTTLPNSPPLEYIDAAMQAGYDGIGIRLFRSPGITYAFHQVAGNPTLMRRVKDAIAHAGMAVLDVLSFYLQPAMDLDSMLPALDLAAEIGAQYALVIGDDPDWGRMCNNFGRFCDAAAQRGLTTALEAPVNSRTVNTLPLALQLIADTGRNHAVICLDPLQYFRAGHNADLLQGQDPRLFPYTQITDGAATGGRCALGEGAVPLRELLDALPADVPLSLEWPAPSGTTYPAAEWAKSVLEHTRRYLQHYYAGRH